MADSVANNALDYYVVLKVHPSADQEIIEAAYRQLMKKHHPDVAGMNARLAEEYHQQAKLINQAHSVLCDPVQRRRYDSMRNYAGSSVAPPPAPPPRSPPRNAPQPTPSPDATAPPAWTNEDESTLGAALRSPFAALAAAYYLLPGAYEWERGHRQELFTTCLLPPVGVAAFLLATGRLAAWVGTSVLQNAAAWLVLLVLLLPSWSSLPRLVLATMPSVVLMSGTIDGVLHQSGIPGWLAWTLFGFVSLLVSARLYVFAVLPTLAVCWLLTRLG